MMAEIFKAYDIRGVYGTDLTDEIAYKIGRAFVTFLKCKSVTVGYDMRVHSKEIFASLSNGIIDQGADVISIGLASTPMLYFAARNAESAIIITASHNPGEYNGFKLCRENCVPISGETGIMDIKKLVLENKFINPARKGKLIEKNVMDEFIAHNLKFAHIDKKLKIVFDHGNGMTGYTFPKIFPKIKNIDPIFMYEEPDGNFPNHEADPLKPENVEDIKRKVVEVGADFGVALDGDGDRCMFIDEKGEYISADMITALVGGELAQEAKKSGHIITVLYDLRSSKIVPEHIHSFGAKTSMSRVGHALIKEQMRKEDAVFAGELSGHFYYKDNSFTESSAITTLIVSRLVCEKGKKISELIAPLRKYYQSGEINSEVKSKEEVFKKLKAKYGHEAKKQYDLDGVSFEFNDWWFNVRGSNTEPKIRLNLEANSQLKMEQKRDEVLAIIRQK